MEIRKYINQKREVYRYLITFIENDDSPGNFENLIKIIQTQGIPNQRQEFEHFLLLLINISNNHHRFPGFFTKIDKILLYYEKEIKQSFSNLELFNIFISNKLLLLFLFKKEILVVDSSIADLLFRMVNIHHFFYPELKPFFDIEKVQKIENDLLKIDPNIFDNFEEKRQIGENDSFICKLIRNDSIHEFVYYVNHSNLPLSSKIKPSIFETNPYLIENEPTLAEYAAFYGSIKIFNYIKSHLNDDENINNEFVYAIHSKSSMMIHLLEENNSHIYDHHHTMYICESIKCHHNNIADYFLNEKSQLLCECDKEVIESAFRYYNYLFFPEKYDQKCIFYFFYCYKYFDIVNFILKQKEFEIIKKIILNDSIFFIKFQKKNYFYKISKKNLFFLIQFQHL